MILYRPYNDGSIVLSARTQHEEIMILCARMGYNP